MATLSFLPVDEDHIDLLLTWVKLPHIRKYWPRTLTDIELHNLYINNFNKQWMYPYIVEVDKKPMGYIQAYEAARIGNELWLEENTRTYGVDFFIGDESFLGQGYGLQMLQEFMKKFQSEHQVEKWVVSHHMENRGALHTYEKCGFKRAIEVDTDDGPTVLMALKF